MQTLLKVDFSDQYPYLIYNIARIIIYLLTCPFSLRFFQNTIANTMKIEDRNLWRYLWIIPLFSTLFGMLYCFNDDIYTYATWEFMISRYLMLFGTCYIALKVLEISRNRTELEETLKYADQIFLAQKKQFDSLFQHLAVVQSYIDKNDRDSLEDYITIYKNELPPDILKLYCRNDVVNALICYYAGISRNNKINFDAKVDYPNLCSISDTDITVLLGNILENAFEACKRQSVNQKFINLSIKRHGKSELLILVDNMCFTPIHFKDGKPLSSKRNDMGIGTISIQDITEKY